MRKYTQKELREYIRLKLARDLTTVDPEELPRHYEKIGYSRGSCQTVRREIIPGQYVGLFCGLLPGSSFPYCGRRL